MPWRRRQRGTKCPVCGHASYCTVADDGTAVRCMRVESNRPAPGRDGSVGWIHPMPGAAAVATMAPVSTPSIDAEAVQKRCRLDISLFRVRKLSRELGIKMDVLIQMGIGWHIDLACYTFPMYDGDRRVIGLRTRNADGTKRCVPGSRNGLFLRRQVFMEETISDIVLLPEGATDTAAAIQLGFDSVGRPQAMGGGQMILKLFGRNRPRCVVVGDNDAPDRLGRCAGRVGAESLHGLLVRAGFSATVIYPPDGIKDLRAWLQAGATHDDIRKAVDRTSV